jgi:hypothetical protein
MAKIPIFVYGSDDHMFNMKNIMSGVYVVKNKIGF